MERLLIENMDEFDKLVEKIKYHGKELNAAWEEFKAFDFKVGSITIEAKETLLKSA